MNHTALILTLQEDCLLCVRVHLNAWGVQVVRNGINAFTFSPLASKMLLRVNLWCLFSCVRFKLSAPEFWYSDFSSFK